MENLKWDTEEYSFNIANMTMMLEGLEKGQKLDMVNIDKEQLFNILQYVNFYCSLHTEFGKLKNEIRSLKKVLCH